MRRWVLVSVSGVAGFALLVFVAHSFRSSIATAAFAFAVDHRDGVKCSHPRIQVSSSLAEIEIAPLECAMRHGPLAHAKTFAPVRIFLDGFRVERAAVARATLDFRARDLSRVESNTLGDVVDIAGMRDAMINSMLDSAELYSPDSPSIRIEHLTMLRAGEKESVLHDYSKQMDGEWSRSRARRVETGIEAIVSARNFDMRATPLRGKVTMALYLGEAERGEEPDVELRVEAERLNQLDPNFEFSLDTDESPSARRARESDEARTAKARLAKHQ